MEVTKLLRTIKKGDFQEAVLALKEMELDTTRAIHAVVCVCNACVQKTINNNLDKKCLSEIINIAVTCIVTPTDDDTKNYISSCYHILKYLIAQGAMDTILETKQVWCPSFITTTSSTEIISSYKSASLLLGDYLTKTSPKANTHHVGELVNILINMTEKLSVDCFLKGPYFYMKCYLETKQDERILLKLSYFLLQKCLAQKGCEQELLELFALMVTPKFPRKVLDSFFSNCEIQVDSLSSTCGIAFSTLRMIIQEGISMITLQSIYYSIMTMENQNEQQLYSRLLQEIFHNFFCRNYYKHKGNLTWQFQGLLYKTVSLVGHILSKAKCKSCQVCQHSNDIPAQLKALMIILGSFKQSVLHNEEIPSDIYELIIDTYTNVDKLIHYLRKKKYTCWENFALRALTDIYNTAIYVNRKRSYPRFSLSMFEMFVKNYLYIQPLTSSNKIIPYSTVHTSLNLIAEDYLSLGELPEAMATIAFNIFKCTKELKTCHCASEWIQVKTSNKRDLSIKKITMALLLSDNKLNKFIPPLSNEQKIETLLKEIKIYCLIWQSKAPLVECCVQLYNLNNPLITAEAICLAWFNIAEYILPEMHDILTNVLDEVKDIPAYNKEKIHIAKLYYLQYHITIKNLENEIADQISLEPKEMLDFDNYRYALEIPDNKWDCTIYEQLKIENLNQINSPLLNSRKIIEHVFSSLDTEKKTLLDEQKILEFIMDLAFTILLHGDKVEYLKTLLLCKKISEMADSANWRVKTIGLIIQELGVNAIIPFSKQASPYLKEGESSVVVRFYINISTVYLNSGIIEQALEHYLKAKDLFTTEKITDQMLSLELELLEWNLLAIPCKKTLDHHYEDFIARPSFICNKLEKFYQEREYTTISLKVMLTQWLMLTHIRYNLWLRCPREGRAAAKSMVKLCQRDILPLRFAETFVYLGDMDLLCEKLHDCQAKINGLAILLDMPTTDVEYDKKPNNIDVITQKLQVMALDVQIPPLTYNLESQSPELRREKVKYPHFLQHNKSCECFHCMSLDYQKLVINHVVLRGNLWASRNEYSTADFFYKFALTIYNDIIKNKAEYEQKIKKLLNVDSLWDVEDMFTECYVNILFNQGKISIGTRNYNRTKDELLKVVEKVKFINPHLYNEICLQMTNHLFSIQHIIPRSPVLLSPIPSRRSPSPLRTPENNISKIIVSPSITLRPTKSAVVKQIKIDWSGDEDENKNSNASTADNPPLSRKRTLNQVDKKSSASSSLAVPSNTGKTSKIKVYSEKENFKSKEKAPAKGPVGILTRKKSSDQILEAVSIENSNSETVNQAKPKMKARRVNKIASDHSSLALSQTVKTEELRRSQRNRTEKK